MSSVPREALPSSFHFDRMKFVEVIRSSNPTWKIYLTNAFKTRELSLTFVRRIFYPHEHTYEASSTRSKKGLFVLS